MGSSLLYRRIYMPVAYTINRREKKLSIEWIGAWLYLNAGI